MLPGGRQIRAERIALIAIPARQFQPAPAHDSAAGFCSPYCLPGPSSRKLIPAVLLAAIFQKFCNIILAVVRLAAYDGVLHIPPLTVVGQRPRGDQQKLAGLMRIDELRLPIRLILFVFLPVILFKLARRPEAFVRFQQQSAKTDVFCAFAVRVVLPRNFFVSAGIVSGTGIEFFVFHNSKISDRMSWKPHPGFLDDLVCAFFNRKSNVSFSAYAFCLSMILLIVFPDRPNPHIGLICMMYGVVSG